MPDPLSFRIKKQFDRYIHDPIAAIIAIPLFLILKLLPYKLSSYLCGILMYLIAPLTSYNNRVKKHLRIVFPNKSIKEINNLTSQHWFMLGQTIGEMPHISNLIKIGNLETESSQITNDNASFFYYSPFYGDLTKNWIKLKH